MGKRISGRDVMGLNRFAKEHGYGVEIGVSPYVQVARALHDLGYDQPPDQSSRQFVLRNLGVVFPKSGKQISAVLNASAKARKTVSPEQAQYVNGPAFIASYEWRQLRMRVLKKYGARCQCCGASAATGAIIQVDHIKPRRRYPELAFTESNLQVLCDACNHGKGAWDETDWRPVEAAA